MRAESAPELRVGDWLDVVDGDGIWNVAQVLRLPTADSVEVTYDCWGDEYNEQLPRNSPRIAPFHTHTWAVKCWAKMDPWPWWPALLTVRAPGSETGSQNLRLEGRLLVDFLDRAEFSERCRCWVKKSKVVSFQSDAEARKRLSKAKTSKRRMKEVTKFKNLAFSASLLAQCDAREDFPEFVEGTLPVKFEHECTRSMEEVRKEMGDQVWLRGFADNRVNHAATHAYTPVFAGDQKSSERKNTDTSKPAQEKSTSSPSKTTASDKVQSQVESTATPGAEVEAKTSASKGSKATTSNGIDSDKQQKTKILRKRSRSIDGNGKHTVQSPRNCQKKPKLVDDKMSSDGTDTSRASASKSPRDNTEIDGEMERQTVKPVSNQQLEDNTAAMLSSDTNTTKELHIAPRKYGKTPKVLKTPRRSTTELPPYTPPCERVLLRVKPQSEQRVNRASRTRNALHATEPPPRDVEAVSENKKLCASGQQPQKQQRMDASTSSNAKTYDGSKSLNAQMTKATAEKTLHSLEYALDDKLLELAAKSAKAEQLRTKCAALFNTPDASRVPTHSRRSSPEKGGIRGLELALDDRISKYQGLGADITRAELDAIKADILKSPEVQAAISRIQKPSYGWTALPVTGASFSSHTSENTHRGLEKINSRYAKQQTATEAPGPRPSLRSPSSEFSRSWGFGGERSSLLRSRDSPKTADYSNFGFSVDDNFSMNRWYRDLYPKTFNFQQP